DVGEVTLETLEKLLADIGRNQLENRGPVPLAELVQPVDIGAVAPGRQPNRGHQRGGYASHRPYDGSLVRLRSRDDDLSDMAIALGVENARSTEFMNDPRIHRYAPELAGHRFAGIASAPVQPPAPRVLKALRGGGYGRQYDGLALRTPADGPSGA